jgi:SecD/SecF fusion protein
MIDFNLKNSFMKTIDIIIICFIAAFSFAQCTSRNSFDYKVTLVPLANSVTIPGDLTKASGVISKRLENFFNIPMDRIKSDISENQIQLTIFNIDTGKIGQIKKVITGYDKLEFWETYENSEIIGYLATANNMLKEMHGTADRSGTDQTQGVANLEEFTKQNPLFGVMRPRVTDKGEPLPSCMIGLTTGKDTSVVNSYLKMDQIKALFPPDIKFYWSAFPYEYDKSKSLFELFAIKVTNGNRIAALDGSAIISAKTVKSSDNPDVKIDLTMDSAGTAKWTNITRKNLKRCIAVNYNGHVRSYPRVMSEITGGNTEITGDFSIEEANNLVNILNSGGLPFQLKIVKEQVIKGV